MTYKEIAKAIILEISYKIECADCARDARAPETREGFFYDNVDPEALDYELRGRV